MRPPAEIASSISNFHSKISFGASFTLKPLFIFFQSLQDFLYLICTLEIHLCFLYLASDKLGIEDINIWIAI
jgi:hypothetical protein